MQGEDISLERLIFNLNTLAEMGAEVTSPKDFSRVVKSALYMVMGSFSASKGVILRYDHDKKALYPVAWKGLGDAGGLEFGLTEDNAKRLAGYTKPVDLKGPEEAVSSLGAVRAFIEGFGARIAASLVVKDELLGLIAINGKITGEDYALYDIRLLSVMAQHIAFSLQSHTLLTKLMHKYTENKALYDKLKQIYYDTIHAFAAAIDAKDAYTKGHSHRVSAYCSVLARELSCSAEDIEGIRIGGLLHDIGKITVDKSIINKASPLNGSESKELNSHPVVGYEILSKIKFPWKGIPMMTRNHHERVDGSGYPDRLKKTDIPFSARVMALVDAFDAMTTDRPYRPRLSFREAMMELKDNLSSQFDPDVVHPFLTVIRKEILGLVETPSIVPLLQEHLDRMSVIRLLEGFPVPKGLDS